MISHDNSAHEQVSSFYKKFVNYQNLYNRGLWKEYRELACDLLVGGLGDREQLRVLDLGGGAMASLPSLLGSSRVTQYTVVDLVVQIPKELEKLTLVENDILSFLASYDGPSFDAVVIFGVLEYLRPGEAKEVMRRLPPILSEGARVLVHEPNSRAGRHLAKGDGRQRTIELDGVLPGTGLLLSKREDYHVIWLRRVFSLLRIHHPKLLRAGLAFERQLGGGVDSLYLLETVSKSEDVMPA